MKVLLYLATFLFLTSCITSKERGPSSQKTDQWLKEGTENAKSRL